MQSVREKACFFFLGVCAAPYIPAAGASARFSLDGSVKYRTSPSAWKTNHRFCQPLPRAGDFFSSQRPSVPSFRAPGSVCGAVPTGSTIAAPEVFVTLTQPPRTAAPSLNSTRRRPSSDVFDRTTSISVPTSRSPSLGESWLKPARIAALRTARYQPRFGSHISTAVASLPSAVASAVRSASSASALASSSTSSTSSRQS